MKPLKYMLLSKMLSGKANEIANLLKGRSIKQYQGEELDSMLQVSRAYEESSLETLRKVLQKYRTFLEDDKIIARNLKSVSDTLLEQNIRRIIEPYSCIEISFIAGKLQMDQYILEKTFKTQICKKD
ncbi:26S proteasome regulatory subunit rpn6, variant 3 [Bonamia ostreae]|uniref:26S proteasome regulatory subunit rpn6, variant 3 n=1 Tax=Bonamia ostreae TaxID=126728 RepID=A0ABV2ATQ3_9EUKA